MHLSQLNIFVEISKNEYLNRIKKYYHWRGKNIADIEQLYQDRMKDEYRIIEKDLTFADIVVTSTTL